MLSAEALAARMAELEADVREVRERSKRRRDDRTLLAAVAQGRGNVETFAKLAMLLAAQDRAEAGADTATVDAEPRMIAAPATEYLTMPHDPEQIRIVLQYLIEAGAAIPRAETAEPSRDAPISPYEQPAPRREAAN